MPLRSIRPIQYIYLLVLGVLVIGFQNCGQGPKPATFDGSSSSIASTPPPSSTPGGLTPNPSPAPSPAPAPGTTLKNEWLTVTTSGGPGPRAKHSAVWTGTEMIIFGGANQVRNPVQTGFLEYASTNTGAIYSPATNTWNSMAAYPFTASGSTRVYSRYGHSSVWTGSKMLIWGGFITDNVGTLNKMTVDTQGASYDRATNTWARLATAGAPPPSTEGTAIWTGSEMIVFGGEAYGPS